MYKKNKKFKSAVLVKQKKKLRILDIISPKKLKKGQVFVKLLSSSICGAQIGEINGIKGKIANEKLSNWRKLIQRKEWENFVKEILENHYDPKYNFSAMKQNNKIIHKIDVTKLNKLSIENASKKILKYFN